MSIGGDTITVVRAAATVDTRYGSQVLDWGSTTSTVIGGVSVQPAASTAPAEQAVDRNYTTDRMVVYAAYGADVLAVDRVEWRGLTFEVDGDPVPWVDDAGVPDHVEIFIKRMTG